METNEKLSFQESLYIGGSPEAPEKSVTVNTRMTVVSKMIPVAYELLF